MQCEGDMWEGRRRHCLQAFQGILPNFFKHRQEAASGFLDLIYTLDYYMLIERGLYSFPHQTNL